MEATFRYSNHFSNASVVIRPQTKLRVNNNNISPSSLPLLTIQFRLRTHELYWHRHEHFKLEERTDIKSLRHLKLPPRVYMSCDMFYCVMQGHLYNWGEEFDRNYRHVVIHDMIGKVRELVDDESNKGCQNLKVFVGITLIVNQFFDGRISLEESSLRFNRVVPTSNMELRERKEIDEYQCINDDCVICFEELGKERKILCMPCSHVFHGVCIIKWLERSHRCPICRYEMPTITTTQYNCTSGI